MKFTPFDIFLIMKAIFKNCKELFQQRNTERSQMRKNHLDAHHPEAITVNILNIKWNHIVSGNSSYIYSENSVESKLLLKFPLKYTSSWTWQLEYKAPILILIYPTLTC